LLGFVAPGSSPAMLLNMTVPRSTYGVQRNIPYGEGARQKFDLYLPKLFSPPAPVVLFFYGGAFRAGRKEEYRIIGEALASKGIITAVADYRIFPEGHFPDFLEDGARALAALHARIAEVGGDPSRIFLSGHSAGAYISVMLAANPAYLRAVNLDVSAIRGVIPIAGRFHELPLGDSIAYEIFRGPARAETRPATYLEGKRPPILLLAGAKDSSEVLDSHRLLAAHLREKGSQVEERTYPKVGHMGIIVALAPGFRSLAPLRDDIVRFVNANGESDNRIPSAVLRTAPRSSR
jgi:acetyl esterase/lipase